MKRLSLSALALLLPVVALYAADAPKGKIVYSRKDNDRYLLHVMNADGTGDKELPDQTANVNLFPVWSPDGKKIAYMAGPAAEFREFQLRIMNADGSGDQAIDAPGKIAGIPAWSPDGKRLAFMAGEGQPNVYVADADGGGRRQVNPQGSGAVFPFWSRDGKKIGYTVMQNQEKRTSVVLADAEGAGSEDLFTVDKIALVGAGGVSPDGKRMVYSAIDPEAQTLSLRIFDLTTKAESTLGDEMKVEAGPDVDRFTAPAWAPDGKSFLVTLATDKGMALFRMADDGKTKTRLTPEGTHCVGGSWLPSP